MLGHIVGVSALKYSGAAMSEGEKLQAQNRTAQSRNWPSSHPFVRDEHPASSTSTSFLTKLLTNASDGHGLHVACFPRHSLDLMWDLSSIPKPEATSDLNR